MLCFVPVIRNTFDVALAEERSAVMLSEMERAGFPVRALPPVTTLEEAQSGAQQIAIEAPALLLIFQATFADSTMVQALAEQASVPVLLWAVPEAHTGGRLRLNSLCGVNLAAHALTRAGLPYHYVYAAPDDATAMPQLRRYYRAAVASHSLRGKKLARMGERPDGFETCDYDAAALLSRFGVEVVALDLETQLFPAMRQVSASSIDVAYADLSGRVTGLETLETGPTRGTLSAWLAMKELAQQESYAGFAVRCWPQFFTEMGCAACAALSMLSEARLPASCEVDVHGTITQMILQSLSGGAAFGTDIVSVDAEADALVLWHCGQAPLSMADQDLLPGVTIHSNRRQPLLFEFPLKPGEVTIARLSAATGGYRLVVGKGEILRAPRSFSGTSGLLHFEQSATMVLDTILTEGLEHHISLTYADFVPELKILARMMGIPILELSA